MQASLAGFLTETIIKIFPKENIDYLLRHKNFFKKRVKEVFNDGFLEERDLWEKFYKKNFNLDVDFSNVSIPKSPIDLDNWMLVFLSNKLTNYLILNLASKLFQVKSNLDLDKTLLIDERSIKDAYAVWVNLDLKPEKNSLGKTAKECDPFRCLGVTLKERVIVEIQYFLKTNKHLDQNYFTLCSGSTSKDELSVPSVSWDTTTNSFIVNLAIYDYSKSDKGGIRLALNDFNYYQIFTE